MPHIDIVVSTDLGKNIAWRDTLRSLHAELASRGYAALGDLKSRVRYCDFALSGEDFEAAQVVATLTMTNPRPEDVMEAMAAIVFDHLGRAVERVAGERWTQCCVFHQFVPKDRYLKRTFNAA